MCLNLTRYDRGYIQKRGWNLSASIQQSHTYKSAYVFTFDYIFEVLKGAASWNFLGEPLILG